MRPQRRNDALAFDHREEGLDFDLSIFLGDVAVPPQPPLGNAPATMFPSARVGSEATDDSGGTILGTSQALGSTSLHADDPTYCAQCCACGCAHAPGQSDGPPLPAGATGELQNAPVIDEGVDVAATPATGIGVRYGDTFKLHSNPGASLKVFLDFDGHTTTGTGWNNSIRGPTFYSPAYSLDGSESFAAAELATVQQIWARITEYYAPFNIDVTTEDPGAAALSYSGAGDSGYGIRVVITDQAWSGGGIAFLGSFAWSSDTPAFVYANNLGDDPKYIADAAAHEAGHTLGLNHDGTSGSGYYRGHAGGGGPSWAPTMGTGYYSDVVQWSRGDYAGASNKEDDLTVITTRNIDVTYRPDDYGNTFSTAAALGGAVAGGVAAVQSWGVISGSGAQNDLDMFAFSVAAGGALDLAVSAWTRAYVTGSATPIYAASPFSMLDVALALYDSTFTRVALSDDIARLDGRIQASGLAGGTYYLSIDGTGWGSPLSATPTGWTEYGSLGQYMVTGSYTVSAPPPAPVLAIAAAAATLAEGAAGTTDFTFTVTRGGDLSGASSATWSAAGAGANPAAAADFAGGVLPTGTVSFAAGEASRTVTIAIAGDTAFETDEGFAVTLSAPVGASLGTAIAAGTILNDDAAPRLLLSKAALATSEAGTTDGLMLSAAGATGDVVVQVAGLDGTEGQLAATAILLNAANGWTAAVSVTGLDDRDADGAAGYALQFGATGFAAVSATVANGDDDIAPADAGNAVTGVRKVTTASGATVAALAADDGIAMTVTEGGTGTSLTAGWRWQFTGLEAGDYRVQVDAASSGEKFRLQYSTDGTGTWKAFPDGPGNATAWNGDFLASGVGSSLWVRLMDLSMTGDAERDSFTVDLLTLEKVVAPTAADVAWA